MSLTVVNPATEMPIAELDFSGSTQFGSEFSVSSLYQNGFTSGRLTGIDISDKGLIQGRPSCWIVVAGPFVFLSLFRVCRLILRKI